MEINLRCSVFSFLLHHLANSFLRLTRIVYIKYFLREKNTHSCPVPSVLTLPESDATLFLRSPVNATESELSLRVILVESTELAAFFFLNFFN